MTDTIKALRDAREARAALDSGRGLVRALDNLFESVSNAEVLDVLIAALAHQAEHAEAGEAITNEQIRLELAKYEPRFRPEYAPFWQGVRFAERYHATPSPSQASEPPQQGELTDEQLNDLWRQVTGCPWIKSEVLSEHRKFARAVIATTPPASEAPIRVAALEEFDVDKLIGDDPIARAAYEDELARLRVSEAPATAAREGWKLVPVEPTDKMVNVNPSMLHPRIAAAIYRSMLAAAPADPEGGDHG